MLRSPHHIVASRVIFAGGPLFVAAVAGSGCAPSLPSDVTEAATALVSGESADTPKYMADARITHFTVPEGMPPGIPYPTFGINERAPAYDASAPLHYYVDNTHPAATDAATQTAMSVARMASQGNG